MIKGSFPVSKVLVFEGIRLFYDCKWYVIATYVEGKNEDIRLFYDCKW